MGFCERHCPQATATGLGLPLAVVVAVALAAAVAKVVAGWVPALEVVTGAVCMVAVTWLAVHLRREFRVVPLRQRQVFPCAPRGWRVFGLTAGASAGLRLPPQQAVSRHLADPAASVAAIEAAVLEGLVLSREVLDVVAPQDVRW